MAAEIDPPGAASRMVRTAVLVLIVALAVGAAVAVLSGRYQVRPVLTGSMRPGLPVGGVVVTERVPISSLQVRDVIVFHRPDNPAELVVHRIISLKHVGDALVIKTQGDNNPVPDPWTVTLRGSTAYRAQFSLPLIGYAAIWWHQPQTRTIALWLAGLCALAALVVLAMPKRFRSKSSRDDAVNQDDPAGPTTAAGSEPSTASTTDAEPETQGGSSTAESLDMAGTSS